MKHTKHRQTIKITLYCFPREGRGEKAVESLKHIKSHSLFIHVLSLPFIVVMCESAGKVKVKGKSEITANESVNMKEEK